MLLDHCRQCRLFNRSGDQQDAAAAAQCRPERKPGPGEQRRPPDAERHEGAGHNGDRLLLFPQPIIEQCSRTWRIVAVGKGGLQCDQFGRYIGLWASF